MVWSDHVDRALNTVINTFRTKDPAIYERGSDLENPVSIRAVFTQPDKSVDPDTGALVDSTEPWAGIRLADLPFEVEGGDYLTIKGKRYRILKSLEDGEGGAKLMLTEDSV